jgi:general transcription factor 3C polypeptide 5 (transcription factor C subunit 1)
MTPKKKNADAASGRAPKFVIPDRDAMTVEHPCIIKNIDKAYSMIGGPAAISRNLKAVPGEVPLNLYFHPEDLASRPVVSIPKVAENILLQVTVPKRTGRKRKRGSDDPFFEEDIDQAPPKDAQYLLQTIQDNPESYTIEPQAAISSTHVWRSMPDFVYSTAQSNFLNDIRSKVLSKNYPLIKDYSLPQTYGLTNTEIIPPAQLSNTTIPNNYSYRSNTLIPIHASPTTHSRTLYAGTLARRLPAPSVHWSSSFPTAPPFTIPPPTKLLPLLTTLRTAFTTRPIWTRRALINHLPPSTSLTLLRQTLPHVAFNIRSGPWRDTICAYGHDPRTSASYRCYQTIAVQLSRANPSLAASLEDSDSEPAAPTGSWTRSSSSTSHIFTGRGTIPPCGSTWQMCDITDPEIASIIALEPTSISPTCEIKQRGWFPAGAWAKLKVGMRWKVEGMLSGTDEGVGPMLRLPDVWDGEGDQGLDMGGGVGEGRWTVLWRAAVRGMIAEEEKRLGAGQVGGHETTRIGEGEEGPANENENVFDDEEDGQGEEPDDENVFDEQEDEDRAETGDEDQDEEGYEDDEED